MSRGATARGFRVVRGPLLRRLDLKPADVVAAVDHLALAPTGTPNSDGQQSAFGYQLVAVDEQIPVTIQSFVFGGL